MRHLRTKPARYLAGFPTILVLVASLLGFIGSGTAEAKPLAPLSGATTASQHIGSNLSFTAPSEFEAHPVPAATDPAAHTAAAQPSAPKPTTYTVTSADYKGLAGIAAKLHDGNTWQTLCGINQPLVKDCDLIYPGWVLHTTGPVHALPTPPAPKPAPVHVAVVPAAAVTHVSAPAQKPVPAPGIASYVGFSHQQLMAAAGIAPSDYFYADFVMRHESGWCPTVNNGETGCPAYHGVYRAYGECQAWPGDKMASAGPDWRTNPVTQLRWCDSNAKAVYGSWYNVYVHWNTYHSW